MIRSAGAILIYLAASVAAVLIFNHNAENSWWALAVLGVGSVVLGAVVRRRSAALLAVLVVPIAVPFEYADHYLGSDAPYVWWFGVWAAPLSALLIVAAILIRGVYERRRRPHSMP